MCIVGKVEVILEAMEVFLGGEAGSWIRAMAAGKKGNVWIPDSLFLLKVHPFM